MSVSTDCLCWDVPFELKELRTSLDSNPNSFVTQYFSHKIGANWSRARISVARHRLSCDAGLCVSRPRGHQIPHHLPSSPPPKHRVIMAKKRLMKRCITPAVAPTPSRLSKKQKKAAKQAVRPADEGGGGGSATAAAAAAAAVSPGGGGGGGGPGSGHEDGSFRSGLEGGRFRSGHSGGDGGSRGRGSVGRSAAQPRHRTWVPRDWEAAPSAPGSGRSTAYAQAADILSTILSAADGDAPPPSPTALCLAPHVTNKRAVYALVISTLRHRVLLADVAARGRLGTISPRLGANPALGLVLLYDLLLSGGRFAAHGPVERALGRARPNLAAALRGALRDAGVETAEELALARLSARPRYVRANALKGGTLDEVLRAFGGEEEEGGVADGGGDVATSAAREGSRGGGPAVSAPRATPVGPPFSDLVRVPPGIDVHDHPLLSSGRAMIQGKSSCLPVAALLDSLAGGPPIAGWTAADATAAPGNKTVQLAAALVAADAGPVIAVERDASRLRTLRSTLSRAGANRVVRVVRGDWLTDNIGAAVAGVQLVLVDPSCSGSGTRMRRMDRLVEDKDEGGDDGGAGGESTRGAPAVEGADDGGDVAYKERLARLAAVQSRMLARALAIPSARRVVYSTCSVEAVENESVVAAALSDARHRDPRSGGGSAATTWRLHPALPSWRRRGISVRGVPAAVSRACLRVDEEEDETDGTLVGRTGAEDAIIRGDGETGGCSGAKFGKRKRQGQPHE